MYYIEYHITIVIVENRIMMMFYTLAGNYLYIDTTIPANITKCSKIYLYIQNFTHLKLHRFTVLNN